MGDDIGSGSICFDFALVQLSAKDTNLPVQLVSTMYSVLTFDFVKFVFSKKATKIDEIFTVNLALPT